MVWEHPEEGAHPHLARAAEVFPEQVPLEELLLGQVSAGLSVDLVGPQLLAPHTKALVGRSVPTLQRRKSRRESINH